MKTPRDRPSWLGALSVLHGLDHLEVDHGPVTKDDRGDRHEARNSHRGHAGNAVAKVAAAGDDRADSHQNAPEEHGEKLLCRRDLPLEFLEAQGADDRAEGNGKNEEHAPGAPEDAEDLFTWTIDVSQVQDNAFHTFDLVPALTGAGRSLSVCLAAPDAEPGNAIGIWGTRQNAYERGTVILEGMPAAGISDLVFELQYRVPVTRAFPVVANRLAEAKPVWWGETWFYLGLGGALLLLLGLLFYACIDGLHRV